MVALDPRINPFRPEIAAKYLQGQVEAARFFEGARHEVVEPIVALRRTASHEARLDTQALLGECVIDYETTDEGWAWGQIETDGYVGWLSANALGKTGRAPTHKIATPRTLGFPGPDIKLPPAVALPMGARLAIVRQDERFAVTAHGWHLPAVHLAPIKARLPDFVAVAEEFSTRLICGAARRRSASTARAWCRSRCKPPAIPARATATCRKWRSANCPRSASCGAAIWCSGRATSPSRATAKPCCTPMRMPWRWRSSRPPMPSRASKRRAATSPA